MPKISPPLVQDHLPQLGWLPVTAAESGTGLRPGHRRILVGGHPILDEYGFLTPELQWTNGILDNDILIPVSHAYELLRSSADFWINELYPGQKDAVDQSANSQGILPPAELLQRLPPLPWSSADQQWGAISNGALPPMPRPSTNDRKSWLDWVISQPEVASHPQQAILLGDPYELIRFSYRNLSSALFTEGIDSLKFPTALCMFTLGLLGFMPRVLCQVCFRLAMPQRLRCANHTQSANIRNVQGKALASWLSSETRLANAVIERLGWTTHPPEFGRRFGLRIAESTLCGLLWDVPEPHANALKQLLTVSLRSSPRVRQRLVGDFEGLPLNAQLARLREALDPHDWIADSWPGKICQAEEWYAVADDLAPGKGITEENQALLKRIEALLAKGVKKKDIASQLFIQPYKVSKLLARRKP